MGFDNVNTIKEFSIISVLMGIGGSVLTILTQFLSNRTQYVMVDGCQSKRVNWSAAGQYFGGVIVPPVHLGVFFHSRE